MLNKFVSWISRFGLRFWVTFVIKSHMCKVFKTLIAQSVMIRGEFMADFLWWQQEIEGGFQLYIYRRRLQFKSCTRVFIVHHWQYRHTYRIKSQFRLFSKQLHNTETHFLNWWYEDCCCSMCDSVYTLSVTSHLDLINISDSNDDIRWQVVKCLFSKYQIQFPSLLSSAPNTLDRIWCDF